MMQLRQWRDEKDPGIFYNYWISFPSDYRLGKKYPLILFMHGAGEVGPDVEKVRVHGVPKIIEKEPYRDIQAITVSPQCPGGKLWFTQYPDVMRFLRAVIAEYPVDEDAVTVTGLSMGGYATFFLAQLYPGFFAAAAPVCGGGIPWIAGDTLRDIPIRMYHGDRDDVVPTVESIQMCDRIQAAGNKDCSLVILHNVGHDSWVYAYEQTDLIEWLAAQRRK
ncbi:MAG: prolyl oligopeptidase family serine peptidase [Clostridiales bacterium]|nr:prolyl oligopeptidase family serine peptidase [Clostridiales bacterium]